MNTLANLSSWKFLLAVLFIYFLNFTHGEYEFVATLYMKQPDNTTRIGSGSFIRTQNDTHPAIIITSKENLENCIIEDSFIRTSTHPFNFGIDFWYNNDSVDIGILSLKWNATLFNTGYQNITIADNSTFGYSIPRKGKIVGYNNSDGVVTSTDTYLLSSSEVYYMNGGRNWANISDQETYAYIDTHEDLITVMNRSSVAFDIYCIGLNGAPIVAEHNGKVVQYGMLRTNFKIFNQSDERLFTFNVGPVLVGSNVTWKACASCATSKAQNNPACGLCSEGLTDKAVELTHHLDNDQFLYKFQLNNNSGIYHPEECSVLDILLNNPTSQPTQGPTTGPTQGPSQPPNEHPSETPTERPTSTPTRRPTDNPTQRRTLRPTQNPTRSPTKHPTKTPTEDPTEAPSNRPSRSPTHHPTQNPTQTPTDEPTPSPTLSPTLGASISQSGRDGQGPYELSSDEPYIIRPRSTLKSLKPLNGSSSDGVQIVQNGNLDWNDDTQLWFIEYDSQTNFYKFKNKDNGRYFDITSSSLLNGADLIQYTGHNQQNQEFNITIASNTTDKVYYRLTARHSNKVLDVWANALTDNTKIIQWDLHGGLNQQFDFWQTCSLTDGKHISQQESCCYANYLGKRDRYGNYLMRRYVNNTCTGNEVVTGFTFSDNFSISGITINTGGSSIHYDVQNNCEPVNITSCTLQ